MSYFNTDRRGTMARLQRVFISYRRDDAVDVAGRVRDWLVKTWKLIPDNVFMDLSTILPGADFEQVIDQEIAKCDAMIIIMSPSWLTHVKSAEVSYPRLEAETGIRRGLQIIPAMVGITTTPTAEDLPESLRPLLRRNIRPIRPDSFDYDMEWVRKALGVRTIRRAPLITTLSALLLVAAGFGGLSQVPAGNPVWRVFHAPMTTRSGDPTVGLTTSSTNPSIGGPSPSGGGTNPSGGGTPPLTLSAVPPVPAHSVVNVGGFHTPDDGYRHGIVATNDGKISEIFYSPAIGVHIAQLTTVPGIVSIAGFYTPDDGYRHVIVATTDGKISEIFYSPAIGVHVAQLTTVSGIVSIAGFYTPEDRYRHVIVATNDGKISDVSYSPSIGLQQAPLGNM
jgi:hypothetical protein